MGIDHGNGHEPQQVGMKLITNDQIGDRRDELRVLRRDIVAQIDGALGQRDDGEIGHERRVGRRPLEIH